MNKNRRSERHHYVPQFYLRFWQNDRKKIWVHPAKGDLPYEAGSHSVAFEKGLYATDEFPEARTVDQEAEFGRIEALFVPTWSALFDNIANPRRKKNLARYIATQHFRHPLRRTEIRTQNSAFSNFLAKIPNSQTEIVVQLPNNTEFMINAEEWRRFLKDTSQSEVIFISGIRQFTEELSDILFNRKWGIIESPDPYFVTSDSPVYLWQGQSKNVRYGFRTPGCIFPHKSLQALSDL